MTKDEAKAFMLKNSRALISKECAHEIVQAFGYPSLLEVVETTDASDNLFVPFALASDIAVFMLAENLVTLENPKWKMPNCPYMGRGKSAQFYTEQAVSALK